MLSRRRLLRSFLPAPALLLPRRARALGGLIGPAGAAPAPAATWGLNRLVYNISDFGAAGVIDAGNTGNPGFLLYRKGQWPNIVSNAVPWGAWKTAPAQSLSDYSVSNGILTITNDTAGNAASFQSACSANNVNGYNGTVFSGSAYFVFTMGFDPTLALHADLSWPLGWSMAVQFLTGTTQHGIEPDFFEAFPNANASIQPTFAVHDWDTSVSQNNQNSNNHGATNLGSPIWTDLNEFGTLHVAAADNGGTGLIQRFFNGVHLTGTDVSYTAGGPASPGASPSNPNGTFAIWDSQAINFIIGCGPNWPATFGKMQVWQA